jgi:hypothetical protein
MSPATPHSPDLTVLGALSWDTLRGPDAVTTVLSALAVAGFVAKKTPPADPGPDVLSCAAADDWVSNPTPEPDPVPKSTLTHVQLELTQTSLDAARDADRDAARAHARRARSLNTARIHGERAVMLSDTGTDPGPDFAKWSKSDIAYREFIPQVACTLHISEKAAETLVTSAHRLVDDLPDTLVMLENGDSSYRHAESMVRHSYLLSPDDLASYEAILIPFALTLTPAAFDSKARRVAESFKDTAIEERHQEALLRRSVTVVPCDDGMAELVLYVDAVDAYAVFNRITDIARDLRHPTDGRTIGQLRADIATALLQRGTTSTPGTPGRGGVDLDFTPTTAEGTRPRKGLGVGIRATVSIHVPVMSILDHSDEPATLDGYGPIALDRALQLTADAPSFLRVLTHPQSGEILSLGPNKYRVSSAMRLFLMTRDLTCRFPGCSTAARFCDLDHTDDWQFGGDTDILNLAHLCEMHHALKHNTNWRYSQDEFGVVTWTSPTGATFITEPETWLQGTPTTTPPQPEEEDGDEEKRIAAAPKRPIGSRGRPPADADSTPETDQGAPDEYLPPDGLPF